MPGSGKTTLARQVADQVRIPYFDLDDEIEKSAGLKVSDIFKAGEVEFRKKETETLQQVIQGNPEFIMATGGGAPCFNDNLTGMKNSGIVIFLDVPVEEICTRISKQSINRPLLQGDLKERITGLRDQRISIYKQAHYTISGSDIVFSDITSLLVPS